MTRVDFVEIELGGEKWTTRWDMIRKIKTRGSKSGLKYATYNIVAYTPEKAYDIAMLHLKWLREDLEGSG